MDYYQFQINTSQSNSDKDIIFAFIQQLAFDSFDDDGLIINAYIPVNQLDEDLIPSLDALATQFDFSYEQLFIKSKNWNAVWESNFQTIVVGSFCGIRAPFHETIENVQHEIVMNPQMAFGTGHHATTYMVIDTMQQLDFTNAKVLDYGCGTGILAILADKLAAAKIDAVDIELPAYENTLENAILNKTNNIIAYHGKLAKIKDKDYDIILANINRNVILDSLLTLYQKLKRGGNLIISGFLVSDRDLLRKTVEKEGFNILEIKEKDNWLCILLNK